MSFELYKMKFKVLLQQGSYISQIDFSYGGSLELTLYIRTNSKCNISYNDIEKHIEEYLDIFSNKKIETIYPFNKIEPTVENIGEVFYEQIKKILYSEDITLETLEIGEIPTRTIVIGKIYDEKNLDDDDKQIEDRDNISQVLLQNIKAISGHQVFSNISLNEKQDIKNLDIESRESIEKQNTIEINNISENEELGIDLLNQDMVVVSKIDDRKHLGIKLFISIMVVFIFALVGTYYLANSGYYPSGVDIYGHLFKSDLLYESIKNKDFYPLYTNLWYNGVQPFRYWAPLPYYLLAFLQFVLGGDALTAYLGFVFIAFFLGGCGWLLWGYKQNRMLICIFFAIIWFFLPDNMRVFFSEGNIPRMTIAIVLPYLFYHIWQFVDSREKKSIISIILIMCLCTLSHVMITAMIGIATFIFLLIYSIIEKKIKESFQVIVGMLLSFVVSGIWLYPALNGGLVGMDTSATAEVMKSLSSNITQSLNPFIRISGNVHFYYYGFSIFLIAIIGIFLANKKSLPGLYVVIIVLLGTTTSVVPVLAKLPLSQLLWTMRFTPIAYAIFILSLLQWRKSKRYFLLLISLILIMDAIPSVNMKQYYYFKSPTIKLIEELDYVKEVTHQRIALLDLSSYGSYPSFKIATVNPKRQYTFGWAWQGASTASNIVMINTALENKYYKYMFDRCLEMGNDTVVVTKELVYKSSIDSDLEFESLIKGADLSGYKLLKETNDSYIFNLGVANNFGVYTEYLGIAIGSSARNISLMYPSFQEGDYINIEKYSFEELSKYKVIYLSGFEYKNRSIAEDLVKALANKGINIIIDMNRIPIDTLTNRMTFLDVTAQSVSFSKAYPELFYKGEIYNAVPFKEDDDTWNTMYLENISNPVGYAWYSNKVLNYFGTNDIDNIYFLGFNIIFHAMETKDPEALKIIDDFLIIESEILPKRNIVPINIEYEEDRIIIDTPITGINTTIAYQDNFVSDEEIINNNNLLIVNENQTKIKIIYPFFIQGLIISMAGFLGSILLIYFIYKKEKKEL